MGLFARIRGLVAGEAAAPEPVTPPATRTFPFGSNEAVASYRATPRDPVEVDVPVAGL